MAQEVSQTELYNGLQEFKKYMQANFPYKATTFTGQINPSVTGVTANIPSFYAQVDGNGALLTLWIKKGLLATDWENVNIDAPSLVAGNNISLALNDTNDTQTISVTGVVLNAQNLGAGTNIFSQKSGDNLQFKSLVAGNHISYSADANTVTIATTGLVATASNLGTGYGIFYQKSSEDLQFKSLVAGTNVTLSADTNSITISASDPTTASNVGTGATLFKQKTGTNLEFKTIVAGTNTSLVQNGNDVTINVAIPTNGQNLGAGVGVFSQKTGDNLQFKTLVAGQNVSLSADANTITITATAAQQANWITVTANTTIPANGGYYIVDTSVTPVTLTLAATLTNAFNLFIKDAKNTFATNNCRVQRGSTAYTVMGDPFLDIDQNNPQLQLGYDTANSNVVI